MNGDLLLLDAGCLCVLPCCTKCFQFRARSVTCDLCQAVSVTSSDRDLWPLSGRERDVK